MEGLLFYVLTALVNAAEVIVFLVLAYYYLVSIFGWQKIEEKKDLTPSKKFALITAAHNEEAVIKYHIESLKKLNYPKELYDIYIIADNCTDTTAEIARSEGVNV
ncbi:MAG: glycosyltransferase, partial [Syntrophomonadaceae bacterium]|nr:glycosyltransferase [Syntrophomonadaceae bacterium]